MAADPRFSHYLRPRFNEESASKVKNIAIARRLEPWPYIISAEQRTQRNFLQVLWDTFTGVEVLVLADALYDTCLEIPNGEELVWIRGDLGDEKNCAHLSVDEVDEVDEENDMEKEKRYGEFLRALSLWKQPATYTVLKHERWIAEWNRNCRACEAALLRAGVTGDIAQAVAELLSNVSDFILEKGFEEIHLREAESIIWK